MIKKFRYNNSKTAIQLSDNSVFYLRILVKNPIFKLDNDLRSTKKWVFKFFEHRSILNTEQSIVHRFKEKFIKLF